MNFSKISLNDVYEKYFNVVEFHALPFNATCAYPVLHSV